MSENIKVSGVESLFIGTSHFVDKPIPINPTDEEINDLVENRAQIYSNNHNIYSMPNGRTFTIIGDEDTWDIHPKYEDYDKNANIQVLKYTTVEGDNSTPLEPLTVVEARCDNSPSWKTYNSFIVDQNFQDFTLKPEKVVDLKYTNPPNSDDIMNMHKLEINHKSPTIINILSNMYSRMEMCRLCNPIVDGKFKPLTLQKSEDWTHNVIAHYHSCDDSHIVDKPAILGATSYNTRNCVRIVYIAWEDNKQVYLYDAWYQLETFDIYPNQERQLISFVPPEFEKYASIPQFGDIFPLKLMTSMLPFCSRDLSIMSFITESLALQGKTSVNKRIVPRNYYLTHRGIATVYGYVDKIQISQRNPVIMFYGRLDSVTIGIYDYRTRTNGKTLYADFKSLYAMDITKIKMKQGLHGIIQSHWFIWDYYYQQKGNVKPDECLLQ